MGTSKNCPLLNSAVVKAPDIDYHKQYCFNLHSTKTQVWHNRWFQSSHPLAQKACHWWKDREVILGEISGSGDFLGGQEVQNHHDTYGQEGMCGHLEMVLLFTTLRDSSSASQFKISELAAQLYISYFSKFWSRPFCNESLARLSSFKKHSTKGRCKKNLKSPNGVILFTNGFRKQVFWYRD